MHPDLARRLPRSRNQPNTIYTRRSGRQACPSYHTLLIRILAIFPDRNPGSGPDSAIYQAA